MKKKKWSALLSLLLAFSLVVSQPTMTYAASLTDVSQNDAGDVEAAEEQDTYSEAETAEPASANQDVSTNDVSANDIPADDVSANDIPADDVSANDIPADDVSANDIPADDVSANDIPNDVSGDPDAEIPVEEMAGELQALSVEQQKTLSALGFKPMPLNTEMVQEKMSLSPVLSSLSSMTADKDYIEGEILYTADSEEEAARIAECYGGTLKGYYEGYALASIEQKVMDAVRVASDVNLPLPAVYPNAIYSISSIAVDSPESDGHPTSAETESTKDSDAVEPPLVTVLGEENVYALNPTDPQYSSQWYHGTVNTAEAWDAAKGDGVEVAVLDTGVDYNHPDLKNNISGHIDCIGDGRNPETIGFGDGKDENGHGTHCAGIIAAAQNNIGGVGIAPKAKIYSVKVMDADGNGNSYYSIVGMLMATERNVDVISMSLGGYCYDALFQQAIDYATGKGIVVVAAAGNGDYLAAGAYGGVDQKVYPAAYNNVISVAATDKDDQFTYFSNYGSWVDIAAPGEDIYSTLPTYANKEGVTDYGSLDGTSMACPIVAGTVALMLSNSSTLKNANNKGGVTKITKALLDSCEYQAEEYFSTRKYPLLDVETAVYAVDGNAAEMPTVSFSSGEPTAKGVVTWRSSDTLSFKTTTQHAKIYYTINGKKPTAKTGTRYYEGTKLRLETSGKVKIQAVTVVGNKTSKVFSKTYTFDVKAVNLTCGSTCKSNMTVVIGKSIQLAVNISPSYVSNKKLTWSSSNPNMKVKNGKVTCSKKAQKGETAVITAKTTDGTEHSFDFTVTATDEASTGIELNATTLTMSYWADEMEEQGTKMDGYVYSFQLIPQSTGAETTQFLYKSSNTKVATVNASGKIRARGKGTAKITVTTNDGSGKKAVCTVKVTTPVFEIWALSSTGYWEDEVIPIGTGCTISMKPYINRGSSSYLYTPSNKKLVWSSSDDKSITAKNGKIKCNKNATAGTTVTVTVKAADGFGTSQTIKFRIVEKAEKIGCLDKGRLKTSDSKTIQVGQEIPDYLSGNMLSIQNQTGTAYSYPISVSVSNRDVVYRQCDQNGKRTILGTKPGTAKITYTVLDGSNKKFTLTVKVK